MLKVLNKFGSAAAHVRRHGVSSFVRGIYHRRVLTPLLLASHTPLRGHERLTSAVHGKRGLEVGGPSYIFRDGAPLPLYSKITHLDMCNFADETVWEGQIAEGPFELGGRPVGHQYICEATEVGQRIGSRQYDFILSSNCLEHVANPLKAIESWLSVLNPGGVLILALPDKRHNFDRLRPDTTLAHLIEDYRSGLGEEDRTHYEEIIALTDMRMVSKAHVPDRAALIAQTEAGPVSRLNHHHIFSPTLLREIFEHFGMETILQAGTGIDHVIAGRLNSAGK
jgi:SAM-dependent methyltransferase